MTRRPSKGKKPRGFGWETSLAEGQTHIGTARIRESHALLRLSGAAPCEPAAQAGDGAARPSKYGNRRCEADGIVFDSERERSRYFDLKRWERAGLISNLRLQVRYEICPAVVLDGRRQRARHYVADFAYVQDGAEVVEDSKGFKTQEYRLKRALMRHVHGVEVHEV